MKDRSFFDKLNKGEFDSADQLLRNGHNLDSYRYQVDVGYDDERVETRSIYFLEEAFNARRLDIVDYLLSRGANFGSHCNKIMNLLLHANATYALTAFQIIIKHQGNSLLYLGGTGNNENFLHYLSMPEELQKKQDHHSYSFTPCQDMVGHHLAFNFTYEQLQKLLSNFTVDKQALNCKNCEGDTPLHKAIKNGNVGLIKWMVETNKIDYAIINGHGRTALELASLAGEEIHNLIKTHAECMPSPTVKPLVANNPATLHFNRQSPPAESFNQLNTFSAA